MIRERLQGRAQRVKCSLCKHEGQRQENPGIHWSAAGLVHWGDSDSGRDSVSKTKWTVTEEDTDANLWLAHIHILMCAHTHACIHTHINVCIHPSMHTYTYWCVHTSMHVHRHDWAEFCKVAALLT